MTDRVAVVGGGIGGAAAALHLARDGHDVVLFESSPRLGGLVVSFEVGGTPLECFYHHLFPQEHHIRRLIDELGLTPRLEWLPSTVGVFARGRLWPFTSPLDLLRFEPLPVVDRVRMGVGALRLGRVRAWEPLDAVPAHEWLTRYTSRKALDVVWGPMLRAKFGSAARDVPAAWMWARFRQRAGARERGGERLGYLRGGFRQLFDALALELVRLGVDVRTETPVGRVVVDGGAVRGVETAAGETVEVSAVVYTGPLPWLAGLVPADHHDQRWTATGGLGAVCVVLELARPLTPVYWTNVCDSTLPFGAVIEHTNLVPSSDYGGRHVVYLGRYFTDEEEVATAELGGLAAGWVDALAASWPGFDAGDVLAVHPFRTSYAAPLVAVGQRARLAPALTACRGLYVATTAQIYPQDRGMSDGVRQGVEVARMVSEAAAGAAAPA